MERCWQSMVCILFGRCLDNMTGMLHLLILGSGLNVVQSTGVAGLCCMLSWYFCLRVTWLCRLALFSLSTMQFSNINSLLIINWHTLYYKSSHISICWCLVVGWVWFELQSHWQQLLNVFFQLKMEGEQLPKATMNTYLKQQTRTPYSNDYLLKMLYIAKEFIARIADKSNVMCQSYQKKTINTQHLDAALRQLGLTNHLHDLKHIEETIKEHNILKREASQRMEEMIAKDKQEERERRKNEEMAKKEVTVREKFDQLEKDEKQMEEQVDYENLQDDEVEVIEKMQ